MSRVATTRLSARGRNGWGKRQVQGQGIGSAIPFGRHNGSAFAYLVPGMEQDDLVGGRAVRMAIEPAPRRRFVGSENLVRLRYEASACGTEV